MSEVNSKVLSKSEIESMDLGDEGNFEQMLDEQMSKSNSGSSIVKGVIVSIKDDEESIQVDVGKKQEGLLYKSEITDKDGNLLYKEGDEIEVVIKGMKNERPYLSHKQALKSKKVVEFLDNYDEDKEYIINGVIVGKNKGGYIVEDDENIEYFMPRSQAYLKDSKSLIGKKIKAKVIKVNKDSKSIVISRKVLIEAQKEERKKIVDDVLAKEEPINGIIKKITSYGMFVDVGGVDGLVHYSEISYKGPVNPAKFYQEGEEVLVKAIKYDEDKRHLSLSIKAANPDPWDELKEQLEEGDAVKVTVSNIEPYGAFVDLGNDIEGFLHVSEISWDKNIKHPKDYLEVDQEIDAEIVELDFEKRKLRVSLKNLLPKPFDEFKSKYKAGDVVKGEVTTTTAFGAFVKIDSVEGLLHNEDLSWERGAKCKDVLNIGDEVEVKIIKIDTEKENISLSKKALEESPIDVFAKTHDNNEILTVKVRDKKEFGVFVELEDGLEALIRNEDLGKNPEEVQNGDELQAAIVFIDSEKNRIRLSVKKVGRIQEKQAMSEFNDDSRTTLGDIISDQLKK